MPRLPQQNVNHVASQMQNLNLNVPRNVANIDPETVERRKYMLDRIFNFLMQRRLQPSEAPSRRLIYIVKRLEDGLFKSASTMEEYLNLETLERRLHILIKRFPTSNHNQQLSHASSSPPIGAMVPTLGFQQTGNSSYTGTSSVGSSFVNNSSSNAIASSTVNSGKAHNIDPETFERRKYMLDRIFNFLMQRRLQPSEAPSRKLIDIVKRLEDGLFKSASTMEEYLDLETLERRLHMLIKRFPARNHNQQSNAIASSTVNSGSFPPTRNGAVAGGYQQSSNSNAFLNNTVGNNMMTSMGVPRMTSQVIPTHGINNSDINGIIATLATTSLKIEPSDSV